MVIIMALVMSTFAISVSQQSRSRSSTLISDATEKQVLYLAEDAANQMIYRLNVNPATTSIPLTDASDVGSNFKYDASYLSGTKPYNKGVGTVRGTGYLMNSASSNAIYSKTVYVEVKTGNGIPIMAYIRSGNTKNNIPYYRVWNGTTWGDEQAAPAVQQGTYVGTYAPDIQFIKLVFDPIGSHAMLGMQDAFGNVWAEEWNGSSFSAPVLVYDSLGTGIRTLTSRDFDIAYENTPTNGVYRAFFVYDDENSYTLVPLFRYWDGSSWSSQTQITAVPSTMKQPTFIELASNPVTGSKEIGMIYQDSGKNVFGEVWNGTGWSTMGQAALWGTVSNASYRAVGLAYENNGTLVFAYGDGTAGNSRIWNGTTLAPEAQFTYNANTIAWLTVKSVPGTNKVYAIYETSLPTYTLFSFAIDGTTWDDHTLPSAWNKNTNYVANDKVVLNNIIYLCLAPNKNQQPPNTTYWRVYNGYGPLYNDYSCLYFDFTNTGSGTLLYSSNSGTLVRMTSDGTMPWLLAQTTSGWIRSYTVAASLPTFPNVLSGYYENVTNDNIREWHTDGSGNWLSVSSVGGVVNPARERLTIAIPNGGFGFTAVKGTWRENY
jgi:hypothetical protein